jgi:hypothetical protein
MIQLISRNIAIYRSLARIKQDPATCHQKLQEPELAWETIQFPQELQPEIKEIEDLHIKQKLEPSDKFSVSKHSLFGHVICHVITLTKRVSECEWTKAWS